MVIEMVYSGLDSNSTTSAMRLVAVKLRTIAGKNSVTNTNTMITAGLFRVLF